MSIFDRLWELWNHDWESPTPPKEFDAREGDRSTPEEIERATQREMERQRTQKKGKQ